MRIKLFHISTEKHLHSHDFRPPVSEVDFQNEVSAYGAPGFAGDANDDWIVEIDEKASRGGKDREAAKRLRTLRTKFRLRHPLTGCYLFSHKVKLPEWGFEQQEVTCNKNAVRMNSLWFVETATHPELPADAPKVNYRLPGFFAKFLELQQVMWTTNAGLTDRHLFDSRPDAWPRLRRGINFWVKDHRQIYLIGNPMVWWLSTLSVVAYMGMRGLLILREKRGFKDFNNSTILKYDGLCGFLFMGWAMHYGPFFLMGRQLFLHHYFPALYFAILLSCAVFDFLTSSLRPKVRLQIAAVLIILAVWNFSRFSPLAYGSPWTRDRCEAAKWGAHWDFSCHDFLNDYSQYNSGVAPPTPVNKTVVQTTISDAVRGNVVVEDKAAANQKGVPDEGENTSVYIPKAEPGRDVHPCSPVEAQILSSKTGGDCDSILPLHSVVLYWVWFIKQREESVQVVFHLELVLNEEYRSLYLDIAAPSAPLHVDSSNYRVVPRGRFGVGRIGCEQEQKTGNIGIPLRLAVSWIPTPRPSTSINSYLCFSSCSSHTTPPRHHINQCRLDYSLPARSSAVSGEDSSICLSDHTSNGYRVRGGKFEF
ncbi:hypothetical protein D9757_007802 [Collybiopsis confluens]|uniref:Dolichyl-phosphate-mannose--protein mannosyltransferase n=1 Tax=Collybiopsis confluens TaxID=2823264 RepID=A0A8H5HPT5_9AGAR|nr:hypothetical protein D9757_007802 [Collybiopsis confluens]